MDCYKVTFERDKIVVAAKTEEEAREIAKFWMDENPGAIVSVEYDIAASADMADSHTCSQHVLPDGTCDVCGKFVGMPEYENE